MNSFLNILKQKIIVFDGATGTHLQGQNLTADDFGGEHYDGCNEYLVVSQPSAVEKVHRDYLETGCDVIETNSFGGASIVLAEYGLQDRAYELNFKAAQIAMDINGLLPVRWDRRRNCLRLDILASKKWQRRFTSK